MLGRLNHVAIAVPNIADAAKIYRDTFGMGAKVSRPVPQPDQGVTTVFVELPNTKIELVEPLGPNSPITKFLQKHKAGAIHHVCYEVEDIIAARDHMRAQGATITGTGEPTIGAHGKPVIFLHPKDFNGTLIELEQV
jgi:methylmalonyl-CoA/ethylmalonyl-CoA epimerase